MASYIVVSYTGEEYLFTWNQSQLESVSALSFLLRMIAKLELFKIYKIENDEPIFLESAYPGDNSSIIQIFPIANPLQSYISRHGGDEESFLREVQEGTNPSIQSMDLGEDYRKNFRPPFALLSWGFPISVPTPPWNGMALLIHIDKEGLKSLRDIIEMLGENFGTHVYIFEQR